MKVLHLVASAEKRAGGVERFVTELDRALIDAGFQSQIAECGKGAGLPPEADVFHFHGLWQVDAPQLASRILASGRRYVVSPHGMLEPWAMRRRFWKKIPYFWLREARFLRSAAALHATSELEQTSIAAWLPRSPVQVIPLGVEAPEAFERGKLRDELGWASDERVLLFLSRLHPKKGVELLIDAFAEQPATAGVRLVVVGDGEAAYVRQLRARADRLKDRLPRTQWIEGIWGDARWRYFAAADWFCLPSYSENFGLVIAEALMAGTPVFTTSATPWSSLADWPGCQIVRPRQEEVTAGLARLLALSPLSATDRQDLEVRARALFAWNRVIHGYTGFYACAARPG